MKTKLFITLVLSCFSWIFCTANDDVKKEINRVKKDNQYIYAESTATSIEEAKEFAEETLLDRINEWVSKNRTLQNNPNLVVNNHKEDWDNYSMRRGSNMYRYFLYVKKSDIIPTENSVATNKEQPNSKADVIPETTVSEPKIEYPEPVAILAACTEYNDMVNKMKALKNEGKVKFYARYASLDNPDNYYLVIYNRAGKVVALLTPGQVRTNVRTNKKEGVSNYKGCGAIGFNL